MIPLSFIFIFILFFVRVLHIVSNHVFGVSSFMVQKLFSLIDQTSVPDNPDSLQNQEVLLPGHLITIYLKVET